MEEKYSSKFSEPYLNFLRQYDRPSEILQRLPKEEFEILTGRSQKAYDFWYNLARKKFNIAADEFLIPTPVSLYFQSLLRHGEVDYGAEDFMRPQDAAIRAAKTGDPELLDYFLNLIPENYRKGWLMSLVSMASIPNIFELEPVLRKYGVSERRIKNLNVSAFAVQADNKEVMENLFLEPEEKRREIGSRFFEGALVSGNVALARDLLATGIPLHLDVEMDFAILSDNVDLIKFLETFKNNLSIQTYEEWLDFAKRVGSMKVAKYFEDRIKEMDAFIQRVIFH